MKINYSSSHKKSSFIIFRTCMFFTVLLFILCSFNFAHAQGDLRFFCSTVKVGKPLSGVNVALYRENEKIKEIVTGKNGKFKFDIEIGHEYKITFSYPGCVNMYMLLNLKVPPGTKDLYPDFSIEVPFFDNSNKLINLSKFQEPFAKIIFNGNKGFYDDPSYDFMKDLFIDPEAKAIAEKKEKAEKERMIAEKAEREAREEAEKERMIAEAERRKAEEKLLATQKAFEEAKAREAERLKAEEVARIREEEEKEKKILEKRNEKTNTDGFSLQQEKEEKKILEKKNTSIKTIYENDLLKTVAENERIEKEKALKKLRVEAEANSVIEVLRKEAVLKAKSSYIREQESRDDKKVLINAQIKAQQMKRMLEMSAFSSRSVKINTQNVFPDIRDYKMIEKASVTITIKEELLKTIKTTSITLNGKTDTYRKETYLWGAEYYYKNNQEIDNTIYQRVVIAKKGL